jgi:outer membrane lipoprotein SlyB
MPLPGTNLRSAGCSASLLLESETVKSLMLGFVLLGMAFAPVAAEAKGCIKGAIVGGFAGHLAGHGKIGAVAGCVIGRREANKREQRDDQKLSRSPPGSRI